METALTPDGELLVRSDQVMRGYRGKPECTAETIDPDGWPHTADVARFDDEGFVWIVDRKKELIINAAGKNMSPANIEMAIRSAGDLIAHVCVIGDARPYNVALLVLDPASTPGTELSYPSLHTPVAEQIAQANATLSRVEQIKKFTILPEDWTPGTELTPTMKLRRNVIHQRYTSQIDALYTSD
ncbi:hypothetical protein [Nocardia sp. NPDC005745]|uniref:hypothetical protein n=1 Tax=Nocardia sp. NPDC005745 TaxID=3157061 RepID=UPI0033C91085